MDYRQVKKQRSQDRLWRSIRDPAQPISGIFLYWYNKSDYSNQLEVKAKTEALVLNKAIRGTTEAWIRCGPHGSRSDKKIHVTVDYMVNGRGKRTHIYFDA